MRNLATCVFAIIVLASASLCPASTIFDVTELHNLDTSGGGTAKGTSNGIGWELSPTFLWSALTFGNETYTGYSNAATHNPPLAYSDTLHMGGETFDITFDQPIASALVYITDNPSPPTDGQIDFGITPTYVSGAIHISGTMFKCGNSGGGVVRLDNINSNVLSHTNPGNGGLTFAIVVTPVPEPSTVTLCVLLGAVSLSVLCLRR